jgi:uncharacterized protein YjbI with pentapeptide repeats
LAVTGELALSWPAPTPERPKRRGRLAVAAVAVLVTAALAAAALALGSWPIGLAAQVCGAIGAVGLVVTRRRSNGSVPGGGGWGPGRAAVAGAAILLLGSVGVAGLAWSRWVTCAPAPAADLSGCDLAGRDLTKLDLSGADLSGADLSEAMLTGLDLSGVALADADLSGADLSDTTLAAADLSRADLSDAVMTGIDLSGTELDEVDLTAVDLAGVNLRDVDLSGVTLTGADLDRSDLTGSTLEGATLDGAGLQDASLIRASFTGADLTGADLTGADLSEADLGGATLTGANLGSAVLTSAALADADLTGADLTGADLTGADLTGATVASVLLNQAVVVDVTGLVDADLAAGLGVTLDDLAGRLIADGLSLQSPDRLAASAQSACSDGVFGRVDYAVPDSILVLTADGAELSDMAHNITTEIGLPQAPAARMATLVVCLSGPVNDVLVERCLFISENDPSATYYLERYRLKREIALIDARGAEPVVGGTAAADGGYPDECPESWSFSEPTASLIGSGPTSSEVVELIRRWL